MCDTNKLVKDLRPFTMKRSGAKANNNRTAKSRTNMNKLGYIWKQLLGFYPNIPNSATRQVIILRQKRGVVEDVVGNGGSINLRVAHSLRPQPQHALLIRPRENFIVEVWLLFHTLLYLYISIMLFASSSEKGTENTQSMFSVPPTASSSESMDSDVVTFPWRLSSVLALIVVLELLPEAGVDAWWLTQPVGVAFGPSPSAPGFRIPSISSR